MSEIKNELDVIAKELDVKFDEVKNSNKDEFNALTSKYDELQKRFDEVEVNNKKAFAASEPKSFKYNLNKAISEGALDAFKRGDSRSVKFDVKADMTTGADFTGEVIPAQRVAGYKFDPSDITHMRQIIPVGTTNSDVVRFVKESAYTDGNAATAEGNALGQSDFNFTAEDANVQRIGTYFRISQEMLDDTPQLTSYLSSRAQNKLLSAEDDQILGGNGVSPNLLGLRNSGTAFAAGAFAGTVTTPNKFDVLIVAINQLRLQNYTPNYILMNPSDFHSLILEKETGAGAAGNYLAGSYLQGIAPTVAGVPVILQNKLPADEFIVGDFATGCQLWTRDAVSVEFFDQDTDNVQKNFVTVRVQQRLAFTTYLPNAFSKGGFAAAIAAL